MKRSPHFARRISYLTCLALILFQLTPKSTVTAQQKPDAPTSTLPQKANLIRLTVTVTDGKDGYAWGLDKSAFSVYDNKVQQEIALFKGEDAPVSVGILLDASGSMGSQKSELFKIIKEALTRFINLSLKTNEYFVIGFNERPYILSDWTRDGNAVLDAISNIEAKKNTALYDACHVGIEQVARGTQQRRVLLLITDGQDNESRVSLNDIRRSLKEADVMVYAVAVGSIQSRIENSTPFQEGHFILDQLTSLTGGNLLVPNNKSELNAAFEQIALELRRQYTIGFTPASDGNWHRIKVKVTPPTNAPREMKRLHTRSREGYYAPAANPR